MTAAPVRDESEYQGLRIRFDARLGKSRIPMQVDIGFGDAIDPPAEEVDFPSLLDQERARIRAYPPEVVVAEKVHALVFLGERNSRLKDFYDLYVLASRFPFDGRRLTRGIVATFERRNTPIAAGSRPISLSAEFYADGRVPGCGATTSRGITFRARRRTSTWSASSSARSPSPRSSPSARSVPS